MYYVIKYMRNSSFRDRDGKMVPPGSMNEKANILNQETLPMEKQNT